MPVLANSRWERFAQELAQGKSQTEAYVAAGYKGDRTVASHLATKRNIVERVHELKSATAARAAVTRESILRELEEDRALARKLNQTAAAVSATMGKAKVAGIVVDRKEVGAPGEFEAIEKMGVNELRAFIDVAAQAIGGGLDASTEGGSARAPRGKPH